MDVNGLERKCLFVCCRGISFVLSGVMLDSKWFSVLEMGIRFIRCCFCCYFDLGFSDWIFCWFFLLDGYF